jgi:hypothetical protein
VDKEERDLHEGYEAHEDKKQSPDLLEIAFLNDTLRHERELW